MRYRLKLWLLKRLSYALGYVILDLRTFNQYAQLEKDYCALMQKREPIEHDGEGSIYQLTQENAKLKDQIFELTGTIAKYHAEIFTRRSK